MKKLPLNPQTKKPLTLSPETVRVLKVDDLKQVAGGRSCICQA